MAGLRLEIQDFADLTRWRWALLDEGTSALLLDHEVRLDPGDWQFQAFSDLTGYLSWHVTPDRRRQDEARIVGEVGAWIGSKVLGPIADALAQNGPVTVRVAVPEAAEPLLLQPLELAHAGGRPLSVQEVTFVMQAGQNRNVLPVGERLRVLGLFSMPEGGRSLNLRRERHSLVRLIQRIAATGKSVDVRVLQYGVSRERLRDVLEEAEGWDIIHVSGHGTPGELLLETAAGKQDRVTAAELSDLLEAARERVKLVTIAACWSAAVTAAEQRHLLGLPTAGQKAQGDDLERSWHPADGGSASGAMATELASRLGCAVLAMRYPVSDEFAMKLTEKVYDLMALQGQPLPRAIGMTLRQLLTGTRYPALSAATPALFGGLAVDLRVTAPDRDRPGNYKTTPLKMAGLPPPPERLVGRTGVMARSSAALAARSGIPGVLLHGMPGGGKTACALELAYVQEHTFDQLVWYKAPDEGMDITGTLTDFALSMERRLDGFQMADVLADPAKLAGFLPRLTELMEQRRALIVIDNAESLLASNGQWRDHRWGQVASALTAHTGPGRVILTSRRVPAGVSGLRAEVVDALSADEALLLTRELPHLRALVNGAVPGVKSRLARPLVRRALNVAQGHPKLLELADGQASNPERLTELVGAGVEAWQARGGLPEGFFTAGETVATGDDYTHVLASWANAATDTMTPGERDLFWFLCCLEERDRQRVIVGPIWPSLWSELGRDSRPPELDQALSALAAQGLVAVQAGTDTEDRSYAIHPVIASTGRDRAGQPFRHTVANQAAAYWEAGFRYASGDAGGGVHTGLLVRAGMGALPYLMWLEEWAQATAMLEHAFNRDPSRANAATVLPAIQRITRHDPRTAGLLARVLRVIDPVAAETQLSAHLDTAVARSDFRAASVTAGRLIDLYRRNGRLAEAMALNDQKVSYTQQAGLGLWTELSDKARRLQLLTAMGQASEVLAELGGLRDEMRSLPASPARSESATPQNVREVLFETGRDAASLLGRWNDALDFSDDLIASMRDRRAPTTEIARAKFGAYGPLLRLGRTDEALSLLLECRQAFEDARDIGMLGMVLSALADTEYQRGQGDVAMHLQRDALRYKYLVMDMPHIAVSYHSLGHYLHADARQDAPALAYHLASALICALTGTTGTDDSVRAAATDLHVFGTDAIPPTDVADLCRQVGDIPGTDLPGLIAALSPDPESAEAALRALVARAQEIAARPPIPSHDENREYR